MLMGLVALAAIQNSEDESTAGGRTRSAVSALYQADAGVEIALNRVRQTPPDLSPIDVSFANGDGVESRTRSEANAQPLAFAGTGAPPDGYALASGGGGGYFSEIYQVNLTALRGAQAVAEVEAKIGALAVGGGGYC
jgi:hypothetical protein